MTEDGAKISIGKDLRLNVPDHPIIPFIEGDGTGPDIWRASVRVFDAAVGKEPYGGKRKIAWKEVLAGEKAFKKFNNWLPDETVDAFPHVSRRHQGPADHARRRRHSLAQCRAAPDARSLRLPAPGALFQGRALAGEASGKGRHGDLPREHRGHLRRHRIRRRLARSAEGARLPRQGISPRNSRRSASAPRRHPRAGRKQLEGIGAPKREGVQVGIGIKPVSYLGTERLVHSAIGYAIKHKRKSVTLVHKGNIMKFTEGGFRDWGYKVAKGFLRRRRDRRRPVVQNSRRQARASSSKTPSPTSRCSRC